MGVNESKEEKNLRACLNRNVKAQIKCPICKKYIGEKTKLFGKEELIRIFYDEKSRHIILNYSYSNKNIQIYIDYIPPADSIKEFNFFKQENLKKSIK